MYILVFMSFHDLIACFFLSRFNIPLYECNTVCLSILLLKAILVAYKFWQLWKKAAINICVQVFPVSEIRFWAQIGMWRFLCTLQTADHFKKYVKFLSTSELGCQLFGSLISSLSSPVLLLFFFFLCFRICHFTLMLCH